MKPLWRLALVLTFLIGGPLWAAGLLLMIPWSVGCYIVTGDADRYCFWYEDCAQAFVDWIRSRT